MAQTIQGQLVDLAKRKIYGAELLIADGHIKAIKKVKSKKGPFILPGMVDAHIHIESSMLVPSEFERLALAFGTLATISDPHEIANVLGVEGVYYMIENAEDLPLEIIFGAPACVPASAFETSGAKLDSKMVEKLLKDPRIGYLSEVMNYPGVIHRDPELIQMISAAKKLKKRVDGHAPGLRGDDLRLYQSAGIETDHECYSYEEAKEKIQLGMKVIIREGSAAKNYNDLAPLIAEFPDQLMFCSDDKHPDDLIKGHINQIVSRAIMDGYNLYDVLKIATLNPRRHYPIKSGMVLEQQTADFILVDDLQSFNVNEVYVKGVLVAKHGSCMVPSTPVTIINQFNTVPVTSEDFKLRALTSNVSVIEAIDGQLITNKIIHPAYILDGYAVSDARHDILKIAVVNRYHKAKPAIGFIKGFGLKAGAIGSCVAHDSHNIIAVGVDDDSLVRVINKIIIQQGGIAACLNSFVLGLELPVAGIMSNQDGYTVAKSYSLIDHFVRTDLKSPLRAPFMTLSFMALPVIPSLKMTDKGLFDSTQFEWTTVFE
ncbi:MAG: adenine deaminase [Saprospiraceae bacterium]